MKYIYIILAGVLLFASCELEEEVYDRIAPESFFKSEVDAEAALNGVYWELGAYAMFKDYLTGNLMLSNDGLLKTSSNGDRGQMATKSITSSSSYIMRTWTGWYNIINNAYLVLQYVPDIPMDEAKKKRILGEAHFMIGYSYFNLGRTFGKAVIKNGAVMSEANMNAPMGTLEDTYQEAINHLLIASTTCIVKSEQPANELGRATKGAVHSTLADLYLTMENWEKARDYADSVIVSSEYSLIENYAELWDVDLEKNAEEKEVIFAVQFKRDPSNTGFAARGSSFPYRVNPRWMANRTGHADNGRGGNEIVVQQWFYDECTTGDYVDDYRSEVSFLTSYVKYNNNKLTKLYPLAKGVKAFPYTNKYVDAKGLGDINNENDLFIYRLSEIYLIKAEACNELGETEPAYTAFNELRARARMADGVERTTPADLTPGLSKGDFRHAVFTERGVEFNFECKRWFDLKRMKRDDGTDYFDYMYVTYIPSLPAERRFAPTLVYEPKMKLWPIPIGEIDRNTSISHDVQNPGY